MTAFIIPMWVHIVVLLATTLYAFMFGGREERLGSGYLVVSNLIGSIVLHLNITDTNIGMFIGPIDVVVFGLLMINSSSYWTVFAAAIAELEVLINIIYTIAVDIGYYGSIPGNWAYMSAQILLCYALMATLIYATWSGRRRKSGLAAVERSSPLDAAAA
jgi:hypothetical protein